MKSVRLQIANVAKETGALLSQYLTDRGLLLDNNAPAVICYGVPSRAAQALNGECGGGDKIRRLVQMKQGGVRTVPWFSGTEMPKGFQFPVLARKIAGHGGEDIVPCFQSQEIPWRVAAGFTWFSSYVPLKTEYRIWMYRGEVLDIYEKVMKRPSEYQYVAGRNYRMGFDFVRHEGRLLQAEIQAKKTLEAIKFDFGAIDMLLGLDDLVYVLECNSAMGAIRSGATATLGKLADRMVQWANNGFPARD